LARIEAHILSLVAGQAAAAEAQGEKADHG
jgi:hypothetical protein